MSAFRDLLSPSRLTQVVDVGANRHGADLPYQPMLNAGLCHLTGFEPEQEAFLELQNACGPNTSYLPYALGDGKPNTLKVCTTESGMTSLLEPDPITLGLFPTLEPLGKVVGHVPLDTHRLDDIREIEHLDFLKIDIQGSELTVFQNGQEKLAEAVAIQVELSFVTLYQNQPPLGEVDLELRGQGFIPHCITAVKRWAMGGLLIGNDPLRALNQLLETDIVYVRDFTRPDVITDEQLKHLALIAHHCYGSWDLAYWCTRRLEDRGAVDAGSAQRYVDEIVNAGTRPQAQP